MVSAKKYILSKHFEGLPQADDLVCIDEELPPLKNNEFLAEAVYFSVDPYMRAYEPTLPLGEVFIGSQVAKITASKSPKYPVGRHVLGNFGWRTHTIYDASEKQEKTEQAVPLILPDFGKLPLSLALGVLGMPGASAYFGFLNICKPKKGETVVVSAAGGAVGSHVGQIAKIKGCKVIGIAGTDKKGEWLINELGFDHFINYKNDDIHQKLEEYAKEGVDCYFDNVGGEISSIVASHMNVMGRISVCGCITTYNSDPANLPKATVMQMFIVQKQLKIEGFVVSRWAQRFPESMKQNLQWIIEGKLKYEETVTEGFENIFQAFIDLLQGANTGKAIIKV